VASSIVTGTFEPLPIGDPVDERALEVLCALFRAWRIRQDTNASERDQARASKLINQLWGAAEVARRGPRAPFPKELVLLSYEQAYRVAANALEEYRDLVKENAWELARESAIEMCLDYLAPLPGRTPMSEGAPTQTAEEEVAKATVAAKRERLKRTLEKWRWIDRRVDGVACELTALQLEITTGLVRVLKHRARQGTKGGHPGRLNIGAARK
jgi:hypothetical protein